MNIVSDIRT